MLYNGDLGNRHFCVVSDAEKTRVASRYCDFDIGQKQSASGQTETWFHLTTRPAFEIACVEGIGKDAHILLMKKRRMANDSVLVKVPGGYLMEQEVEEPNTKAVIEKLAREGAGSVGFSDLLLLAPTLEKRFAAYGIEVKFQTLNWVGCVVGHEEIVIPVFLFWTPDWKLAGSPPRGVELIKVPLRDAVKMARKAVLTGRKSEGALENDSSVELIFSLWSDLSQ